MAKKPNILLITSDQQHWNTIGAFNHEISTPNLDRLVQEGTVFNRAYCPNPTCTPSRSSIITGMYPSQHGAWALGTKLPEDARTVGEELQASGYETALIGKGHFQPLVSTQMYPSIECEQQLQDLEFWKSFKGPFYGFKHVEMLRNHAHEHLAGQHYAIWMEEQGFDWKAHFAEPTGTLPYGTEHHWSLPEEVHYNNWIAERTNAYLEQFQSEDQPFMLWASFPDPHPPYLVSEPWASMYDPEKLTLPALTPGEHERNPPHFGKTQQASPDFSSYQETGKGVHGFSSHLIPEQTQKKNMAVYYGMISFMDKYIGRILDKLDELGLAEDTIVVYTTDHGHFFGQHGLQLKGAFHYEDLLKIPFIVRYPGEVPAGTVSGAMQSLVDLAPTFLSFAGHSIPRVMTGVDQSNVWLGRQLEARNHIICEHRNEPTTMHVRTYVNHRYKLTVYYNRSYGELFDLQDDPGELYNQWDAPPYQRIKSELLLSFLWAEMGKEPLWMPRLHHA
ncbi:sulfatase-like hydrolase/transferase [Paenibacillus sp. LMG 31460]|uniref:Sulfatase-like hydrolase/transferase n=1 Tax=Paenibacillus germinis TaxID=2654979 RepID=A0ABX1Z4N5_9BACL|nr:sulfatase-like hydrolase/transferase [Paenibacillus germinis]NOU88352.1 sulfatase-like hydrolase/transferase [Paenibacillus germinis]